MQALTGQASRRRVLLGGAGIGASLLLGGCSVAPVPANRATWSDGLVLDPDLLTSEPAFEPTAGIGWDGGFLLLGTATPQSGEGFPSAMVASADGRDWRRLPRQVFPVTDGSRLASLGGAVYHRGMLWVIGSEGKDRLFGDDAVIWRSSDGLSWTRAAVARKLESPDDARIEVHDDRLFFFASSYAGPTQWWRSPDGSTWTEETPLSDFGLEGTVSTSAGLLLFGTTAGSGPTVHLIGDGGKQDISDRFERLKFPRIAAATAHRAVLVGDASGGSSRGIPAAWSTADGVDWGISTKFELPDTVFDVSVQSICAAGAGFVAVGSAKRIYRPAGLVWFSVDGVTWTLLDDLAGRATVTACAGGQLIVAEEVSAVSAADDASMRSGAVLHVYSAR